MSTYVILIDGLRRPLPNFELIDTNWNVLSRRLEALFGTLHKSSRKFKLRTVSLDVKVSEVEWLHVVSRLMNNLRWKVVM
jgi:hypothetical protein